MKLLDNHATSFAKTCMHTLSSMNRTTGIMQSLRLIIFTVPEKLSTKGFLVVLATHWLAAKPSTQPNTDHYVNSLLHESQQQNINFHKNNACTYKTVTIYWKRIWTGLKGRRTLSTSSRRQKGRRHEPTHAGAHKHMDAFKIVWKIHLYKQVSLLNPHPTSCYIPSVHLRVCVHSCTVQKEYSIMTI